VLRDGATRTVDVKTAPDPADKQHSIIGVLTSCALQTADEDLASRAGAHRPRSGRRAVRQGLAFALDVAEKLGHRRRPRPQGGRDRRDVPRRSVVPVGGLKQKTIGARRAGADVFPRSGWGKRTGSAALRRKHARNPCAQLSTGVARPGNS
jgi:hypothetical protein